MTCDYCGQIVAQCECNPLHNPNHQHNNSIEEIETYLSSLGYEIDLDDELPF